jgi:CMP-N,N'-diacetyllegionaminic acid synthase
MKPLIVIPARGGSKGLPGKNIKMLNGKPLILFTIEVARSLFDDKIICVSTDDEEIAKVARQLIKVPFLRPQNLATDMSGTEEVLLHALGHYNSNGYEPDTIILLQPTSPFRTADQIKDALSLYNRDVDMVVSAKETKANPYYLLFEDDENGYLQKSKNRNFIRRQDCPKVWELNGAIYIINVQSLVEKGMSGFTKRVKYVMDDLSSHDIDSEYDWEIAKVIASRLQLLNKKS